MLVVCSLLSPSFFGMILRRVRRWGEGEEEDDEGRKVREKKEEC